MAKLNKTTVKLSDVQKALGFFPNCVSGVCQYAGINKWSKTKPFRSGTPYFGSYDQLRSAAMTLNFGLAWDGGADEDSFSLLLPKGGSSSPCRLGDFRGYDHFQGHGIGIYNLSPTVSIDNLSGSHDIRIYGGEESDFIGFWDLRALLNAGGYRYLLMRLSIPRSGLVGSTAIDIQTVDLLSYSSVPVFALPNRTVCKLGRTDDGAGTLSAILVSNSGSSQILFDWQHKGIYTADIQVSNVDHENWGWNKDAAMVGYRNGSVDVLQPFRYWQEVPMGSPRYLDLTGKEYLMIDTATAVNGPESVTLDYNNVRLRITEWTSKKEWYCQTYGDEKNTAYYWTLGPDTATGLKLKIAANALPDFGSGMFGFSMVYSPDSIINAQSSFLPLTKESFARVTFPATGNTPVDIF